MTVQLGSSGPEVTQVQQQLVDLGFPIAVDGAFGPVTDEAVRGFQLVTRLTVDGIVGASTHAALDEGHWGVIADETVTSLPQLRRELTESVATVGVTVEFTADVRWYHVLISSFYTTAALNTKLDAMAATWISNMRANAQPVEFGEAPNSVIGALDATLIAPSIASAAGQLSEFVAGSAHPNPRIVIANMDIAANKTIPGTDLFRAGSSWPTALRNVVLLHGFDPADVAAPTVANFSRVAITPGGLLLCLYPDQVGLPLAAGIQQISCPWVRIESVVRPSIIARAFGGNAGGPGPHVP
jgi:hypothetical protein